MKLSLVVVLRFGRHLVGHYDAGLIDGQLPLAGSSRTNALNFAAPMPVLLKTPASPLWGVPFAHPGLGDRVI